MPIYEYKCDSCDTHFEKIQKASDEPLRTCEDCGGALQKQWSLSGFQFKGAGWYVTDYGKGNGDKSAPSGEKQEKKESSGSTESSDSASKKESNSPSEKKKVSDKP